MFQGRDKAAQAREVVPVKPRSRSRGFVLFLLAAGLPMIGRAEKRVFDMTIEDTKITLVEQQGFHTFAFDGQVPGPLIHVKEGDEVSVNVSNLTTLPHTIHWHGILQRGTWKSDGVPDVTQAAIQPGDTYTYKFVAEPSGTLWYHCHVNVNEHVAMRGMWGPLIIDPKTPLPIEKTVTRDYIMMLSTWVPKWAFKPGYGGVPGDEPDYFTMNGKAYPDTQPLRVNPGDVIRIRLIGAGDAFHSIHIHGHIFKIVFKDGRPLANPILADTVVIGPGERKDLFITCDNPGRWMVHDHVDAHTVNGEKPMGGIMTVIEYNNVERTDSFYIWRNKQFIPDFFYEESMKKPYGKHDAPAFKGKAIQ
jgi:FtsP/CotA-like multicopper oxidase with cupredoxin domain